MTAVMPWERADSKVCDRHLQRLAVVYIRQSTRQQLVDHKESTRLQYALVDRAGTLGWETDRVLVIDEDLGMSATSAVARTGFLCLPFPGLRRPRPPRGLRVPGAAAGRVRWVPGCGCGACGARWGWVG
ncbi:hypothetical protein ACH4PU_30900 [Streptomyces sp. NPDC021100]|uniref:hypothetical protein n=1 Tax=Streptomyces sp. NPDC021100 TaxID=3365114 RepID=UPI00379255ED